MRTRGRKSQRMETIPPLSMQPIIARPSNGYCIFPLRCYNLILVDQTIDQRGLPEHPRFFSGTVLVTEMELEYDFKN